jgi:hypothetical protein
VSGNRKSRNCGSASGKSRKKSQPQSRRDKKPQRSRNRRDILKFSRKELATAEIYYKKVAEKSQPQKYYSKKPQRSRNRRASFNKATKAASGFLRLYFESITSNQYYSLI